MKWQARITKGCRVETRAHGVRKGVRQQESATESCIQRQKRFTKLLRKSRVYRSFV